MSWAGKAEAAVTLGCVCRGALCSPTKLCGFGGLYLLTALLKNKVNLEKS